MVSIQEVKKRHEVALFRKANVVGVGLNGDTIVVLVEHKMSEDHLAPWDIVPHNLDGVPTDVIEVGHIQAPPPFRAESVYVHRARPPVPGVSLGHMDVTAGTFGCVVNYLGEPMILSNNHVMAQSNLANYGDLILQPGRYDGGVLADGIATLEEYIPINLTSSASCAVASMVCDTLNTLAKLSGRTHRMMAFDTNPERNKVDAAIAKPLVPIETDIIDGVGTPKGVGSPQLGMKVHKCGRTTGHTYGTVKQLEVTVQVSYGTNSVAFFEDQVVVVGDSGMFSAGGDSGSVVLDTDGYAVGLLFAGSDKITLMNPMSTVLTELGIEL